MRALVQGCPAVRAKLDRALSSRPDFDSIGDAANERLAECGYLRELGAAVREGYGVTDRCSAIGAAALATDRAALRAVLSRIEAAADHACGE